MTIALSKYRLIGASTCLALALSFGTAPFAVAEEKKAEKSEEKKEEEEKKKTLEEVIKDHEAIDGLFPLYRDKETGALMMEISETHFQQEFIYHAQTLDGAAEVGFRHILGSYVNEGIVSLRKDYNKIEIVRENTSFYHDPESAMARAKDANIADSLLAVMEIKATSEDGTRYLVEADGVFKTEALSQLTPSPNPNQPPNQPPSFSLGGLSGDKTKIAKVRNYPMNMDIIVDYTYSDDVPGVHGGPALADSRNVTVRLQHSLIQMPAEEGFERRLADPRVGYFMNYRFDLTDPDAQPYRDLITKWRLVKKDPAAAISEPVEPITFWIENTTPVEYRDAIRDGVLAWNPAFESAGFKNAIEVKIQPDDAEWDAGDILYNVIRWVSSPTPFYGGYGPSLSNPRTGEIIAADIVLEYVFTTNRIRYDEIFDRAALAEAELPAGHQRHNGREFCNFGEHMQLNTMLGKAVLMSQGASDADISRLVKEGLYELALHEVGHTLGLQHNMKASSAIPYGDIHNKEITARTGLTSSVMDYTPINLSKKAEDQGHYYTFVPGTYDHWAIQYGYTPSLSDPNAEEERVKALLAKSTQVGYRHGNDADDMRSSRAGIDPRVMIDDLTDDPVAYAVDRMELVDEKLGSLKSHFERDGKTWHHMRWAYLVLTGQKATQARVLTRQIGGIHVERFVIGEENGSVPYQPVDTAQQKKAMAALAKHILAPDAFDGSAELYQHLQPKKRGWEFYGNTEDPKIHARIMGIQMMVVSHLLHANTHQRLIDSGLYGNDYAVAEMLDDLTIAVFEADLKSSVNTFRQNLQVAYTRQLGGISEGAPGYSNVSRAAAHQQLRRIERMMRKGRRPDPATDAHRHYVRSIAETALYGQPKPY